MHLTFFHRRPTHIHYSLEFLFDAIRTNLPNTIKTAKWISPQYSVGLWPRLKMTWDARQHQGDINHITGDIHFIAMALKKRKTILTIHDLGVLNNPTNALARWVLKTFWITLPVKSVAMVTVVSEATKHELIRVTGVSADKVRVIGNFIPGSFTHVPKYFNTELPRILHIGSAYNKNLDRLIEALSGLPCHLVIIGYPSDAQKKLLRARSISHQILSGLSESELIEQYCQCDMLAFVSLLEGFGLPILEAQAIGRVVVTSNLSSMPEVAGNGACFVDPYNIAAIRAGIVNVINDKTFRDNLIINGLANVKKYSLEKITTEYIALYNELYKNSNS